MQSVQAFEAFLSIAAGSLSAQETYQYRLIYFLVVQ